MNTHKTIQSIFLAVVLISFTDVPWLAAQQPVVTHTAVVSTTVGDFIIELYGNDAPRTVANFVGLAERGFYDSLVFHRIAPNFVVQTGDPKTKDTATPQSEWGKGGESIYGTPFEDELNTMMPSYKRGYVEGTLAMANRGANTNLSQFFIMLKTSQKMKKNFTIFGKVATGMDVVHSIENTERTTLVIIQSVKITKNEK